MKIKELKIYSSDIPAQVEFYTTILGVKLIETTDKNARLAFGSSILNLTYSAEMTPYHFAINIPSNKYIEAHEWLKQRVEVLKDGAHEIQDFDFWNAKAIYFYDADHNIVELIARKNLDNPSDQSFSTTQFLEISEIGVPCSVIEHQFNRLHSLTGIEIFDGGFERFCAIGDENGLFICINKHKKDWFPTDDKAFSSEFQIEFMEKGNDYHLGFKDEKFQFLSQKTHDL